MEKVEKCHKKLEQIYGTINNRKILGKQFDYWKVILSPSALKNSRGSVVPEFDEFIRKVEMEMY